MRFNVSFSVIDNLQSLKHDVLELVLQSGIAMKDSMKFQRAQCIDRYLMISKIATFCVGSPRLYPLTPCMRRRSSLSFPDVEVKEAEYSSFESQKI